MLFWIVSKPRQASSFSAARLPPGRKLEISPPLSISAVYSALMRLLLTASQPAEQEGATQNWPSPSFIETVSCCPKVPRHLF